ncbi:hypothetical protein J7643_11870 [bacterium]|nr:hypothetical protein [bacterium]
MSVHYICWFSQGSDGEAGFVPTDGGCHHEEDYIAWEMTEVLRNNFGINFPAFVPVLSDMGEVDPALLPEPTRCLEVFSETMRETLAGTEQFMIKDIFNQPKHIPGPAVAEWLDEYRKRWGQGYFLVRVPETSR